MADGHPGDHAEGAHIAGVDGHICPKAVDDCIDHGVITDQFYLLALAAVHPEGGRKKIIDTEVRRDRYGFLRKNVRTGADTVHTEASDGLMLVRIAQYIVIIAVPDQTIGAEDVPFAVVAQLLLLSDVVGKVLEGNLLSGIDGLIDCIHDQQILSIFRLHPSLHGSVALQFLGLMLSGQRDNLGDHLLAAFFGDELGGLHSIDQQLQLSDFKLTANEVIAVLSGLYFLDVHSELLQKLNVRLDGLPVRRDTIFCFEDLRQLHRGQIVVFIGALI